MEPTFRDGDWLLFLYFPQRIRAVLAELLLRRSLGKVILLRRKADPTQLVVKRLIREYDTGYWVEGDNKEGSTDSRHYLTIEADEIVGLLLCRYRRAPKAD